MSAMLASPRGQRALIGPFVSAAGTDPATGTLTVWFPAQARDIIVWRLSISGPASSIARFYLGAVSPATFIDVSYFGTVDSADYPAGFLLPAGQQLVGAWYDVAPPASIAAPVPILGAAAGAATAMADFTYL